MTDGIPTPPTAPENPARTPASSRSRRQVTDTVQRIMGGEITSPVSPPDDLVRPTHPAESGESPTAEVAKDQAAQVADTAKQAGTQVVDTVKDQAAQVTAETGKQARELLSQAQSEVREQAAATQQRVAEGLHALADELTGMTENSDQDGPATDLARQAAQKAHQAAGWLTDRDPGALLDEVRSFARRKPGTYLAVALGAGVLAGRLTRGLAAPPDAPIDTSASAGLAAAQFGGTESSVGYSAAVTGELPGLPDPMAGPGATSAHSGGRGDVAP